MAEQYLRKLTPEEGKTLEAWWEWLDDHRGDRSRLRRAVSPEDVVLTNAFFHFLTQMDWKEEQALLRYALVAGIVSHVKQNQVPRLEKKALGGKKRTVLVGFAGQLATPKEGAQRPVMSETRFQQLQKSDSLETFYRQVLRAVRLLGGNVNLLSLADNLLHWYDEFHRLQHYQAQKPQDRLAVRWATEYFSTLTHFNLI